MKNYFLAGLAMILPIIVTLFLIQTVVNFLTAPFLGIVEALFPQANLDPILLSVLSKIAVLIFLFFATAAVGYFAEYFFVRSLIGWGNWLIRKIPLVGSIYQMLQDALRTFYDKQDQFSKVGKVPFPTTASSTLGFITNEEMTIGGKEELGTFASVYIPGNPNPIMGFWLLVPKDQVTLLDISAKEASRFIFSCGILKNESISHSLGTD